MGIYNANMYKIVGEVTPPNKRLDVFLHWLWSLVSPLQWLYEALFDTWRTGVSDPAYTDYSAGSYDKGDRVKYINGVYESLEDSNTDLPTTSKWVLITDNFIGVEDRVLFNGQKIIYEYALNTWFGTTFDPVPGDSDIYIETNAIVTGNFRTGVSEARSSSIGVTRSSEPIGDETQAIAGYNFTIYIPTAVYNALDADSANREKIVRNFADRYCPVGLNYNIQTY